MDETCFVKTIKNRCRLCFTCVLKCPAKAIRMSKSQAEVIPERCIGCGSCYRVCSQRAKEVVSTLEPVRELLRSGSRVAAILAPSFPVEFLHEVDFRVLVGMIRALGFSLVCEVAFGADLIAERYRQLMAGRKKGAQYVATTCPAVVGFVERYQPELTPRLAPIVSPMVAMARALRALEGADLKIVFIGPCIAKKVEASDSRVSGNVDVAITFEELRQMFTARGVTPETVEPSDFDPPHPGLGALFPITGGMLQAANIAEDLMTGEVVATEGKTNFTCAVGELAVGALEANLVEMLACHGCIAGPALTSKDTLFKRRSQVSRYVRFRMGSFDEETWHRTTSRLANLNLSRGFAPRDRRIQPPPEEEVVRILARMGKKTKEDELNCGSCGYLTCREHAIAIYHGLAESEMCLPFIVEELKTTVNELSLSNQQLASTQESLMHSERLASMGQLAAGVAHEVNNPLGIVLMYAHLLLEDCPPDSPVRKDLEMIAEQASRCKKIVSGLLDFARQNKVTHEPTELGALVARSMQALPPPAGVRVVVQQDSPDTTAEIDRDQVVQILTNLVTNAYDAMPQGGTLTVRTRADENWVVLEVEDTGVGIPRENYKKIFEPFFTTKQMGKGTGLGLAVVYGIVKMHRGDISLSSNCDPAAGPTGTVFRVSLPRKLKAG